jgi:hypothetical protein
MSLFNCEFRSRGTINAIDVYHRPRLLTERLKNFQDRGFRAETAAELVSPTRIHKQELAYVERKSLAADRVILIPAHAD